MIDCEKPGDCAYPGCECQDDNDPFNEEPAMTQTQQATHTPGPSSVLYVLGNGIRRTEHFPTAAEARRAYERALASKVYMQVHICENPAKAEGR